MSGPIDLSLIKALTFDVFGTVVDWRTSIIRELREFGISKGTVIDWAGFADKWRGGYAPSMDRVRKGELPWMNIDSLHKMVLEELLEDYNFTDLEDEEIEHLNRAWHRLTPWPDSVQGLERMRTHFTVATLSNGNVSLLVELSKYGGLPWDCILSSELAEHYKPDREVYLKAAELLSLNPEEIMMVAAHEDDLHAAASLGFATAFVSRPLEFGPSGEDDEREDMSFDVIASDFIELARKLGV